MKLLTRPLALPASLEPLPAPPRPCRVAAFTLAAFVALAGAAAGAELPSGDGASGDPTEDDPVLKFAKENGSGGIFFALDCSSVIDGGPTLDGEGVASLPVGGGRRLECSIDVPRQVVDFINDSTGAPWCQLGRMTDFKTDALDERLSLTIESSPSEGPWSVVATHAGDEITIIRASAVWPLGIEVNYATVDLQPAQGRTCAEVFGL